MIASRALDRRVRIERRAETRDSSGQSVVTWHPVATVWAKVEPLGGGESAKTPGVVATADTRFTIRYRRDVEPTYRIVFEDRAYDVVNVAEEGRRRGLVILARARAEA